MSIVIVMTFIWVKISLQNYLHVKIQMHIKIQMIIAVAFTKPIVMQSVRARQTFFSFHLSISICIWNKSKGALRG